MQTMKMTLCARLALAAAALLPGMVVAQTVVGSGCATLSTVNGQQSIVLSQPVAANAWIIVSAAVNNTGAQFANTPVTDSGNNTYPISDLTIMASGSGLLVTFAGRATTALNAGDQITVNYSYDGSPTAQSCVEAAAFSGVLALADPSDAYGESSGTGTAESVTSDSKTQYASDLVYSVFASAQTPGTLTAVTPAQALDQVCSGDGTLCLLPAWNLGATSASIYEGADADSTNSVAWGALMITFQSNDRIFADGFDGD